VKQSITEQLAALTCKLVSFKTTEDRPQEVEKAYNYLKGCLKGCNVNITEYEKNGKKSLVFYRGNTPNRKHFKVIFLCHIDVVPAKDELFTPRITNSRIYGRGAYDMKAGCAIGLMLIKKIKTDNFAVIYTSDEEIGGTDGAAFLVEKGYRAEFVIALESTDCKIVCERKGVIRITISAKGKSVHSSVPWEGINALDKLIAVYNEVKKDFPVITPKSSDDEKFQKTLNLALMRGGDVFNKVVDNAYMYLDIRYTRKDNPESILKSIKKICKTYRCNVSNAWHSPTLFTDSNHPFVQKIAKIGRFKITREHGASDCRYFSKIGIPAVDLGAKGRYHHGNGEYLEIPSLKKIYDVMETFLTQQEA